MNLVKLGVGTKHPCWVNPENVTLVRTGEYGTEIWFIGDESPMTIDVPVETVVNLLSEA